MDEGVSASVECINLGLLLSDPTSIFSIISPVRICLETPNNHVVTLLLCKRATSPFLGNKENTGHEMEAEGTN